MTIWIKTSNEALHELWDFKDIVMVLSGDALLAAQIEDKLIGLCVQL
jgi:hypothetical protein